MPNYADPFEAAGRAAGGTAGAAGGGLLGALGSILEPLDYPRQALWNLVRAAGRAITGEGEWSDALRAAPGALGGALAGGLAATGVGAPLGILAGSALGGLSQGIGKAADSETFQAPEVKDLTGTDDFLTNALVGGALDPMTYAGGIGGAARGAKAGREFGQGLEAAAAWRGPRYTGGAETLSTAMANSGHKAGENTLGDLVRMISENPDTLSELAPGSTYLGHGQQTLAFRTPEGGVTSFMTPSWHEGNILTRPDIPEMLQASRSKLYTGAKDVALPIRVEHTPYLDRPISPRQPSESLLQYMNRAGSEVESVAEPWKRELAQRGIDFLDNHPGNYGIAPSGQRFILDPESVQGFRGAELPRVPDMAAAEPTRFQSALLDMLGADKSVRNEIAAGSSRYRGGTQMRGRSPELATQAIAESVAETPRPLQAALRPAERSPPRLEEYIAEALQNGGGRTRSDWLNLYNHANVAGEGIPDTLLQELANRAGVSFTPLVGSTAKAMM